MKQNRFLIAASALSFIASLLHVACIFGGPDWYRFFGAGEQMAQLAEQGSTYPTYVTLAIAVIIALWGLYALSGAGVILKTATFKNSFGINHRNLFSARYCGFNHSFFNYKPNNSPQLY